MRRTTLFLALLTTFLLINVFSYAQIQERRIKAIETLETGVTFIYQGVDIPVLDISYHEWSSDSVSWGKTYTEGDCYLRISNDTKTTWVGFNVCNSGSGTSAIDTIIICDGGVCDTIVNGTATINIPTPNTITGTTTNTSDDTYHTHELILSMGQVENVDTSLVVDGYVLKWDAAGQEWVGRPDLVGGGGGTSLNVNDGTVDVDGVSEIQVQNGTLTDLGAGAVSIDFLLEGEQTEQDFFRTDTVDAIAGNNTLTFTTPLPLADYVVASAYALYDNGEKQTLSYDTKTTDGFRVLDVIGESEIHYLVMRNLDSLGMVVDGIGRVYASGSDTELGYLNQKVDNETIGIVNDELTVIGLTPTVTTVNSATHSTTSTDDILLITYTATGACTITIDTDDLVSGRTFTIKATTGVISNNATIETEGSELIDGSATFVLSSDYDAIDLFSDGINWYIR